MADITRPTTVFKIHRRHTNAQLSIMQIVGFFQFGPTMQRAVLIGFQTKAVNFANRELMAAGWGALSKKPNSKRSKDLFFRQVYFSNKSPPSNEHRAHRFLISAKDGKALEFNKDERAGPVWDVNTGEVVGLMLEEVDVDNVKMQLCVSVASSRDWIDKALEEYVVDRIPEKVPWD